MRFSTLQPKTRFKRDRPLGIPVRISVTWLCALYRLLGGALVLVLGTAPLVRWPGVPKRKVAEDHRT